MYLVFWVSALQSEAGDALVRVDWIRAFVIFIQFLSKMGDDIVIKYSKISKLRFTNVVELVVQVEQLHRCHPKRTDFRMVVPNIWMTRVDKPIPTKWRYIHVSLTRFRLSNYWSVSGTPERNFVFHECKWAHGKIYDGKRSLEIYRRKRNSVQIPWPFTVCHFSASVQTPYIISHIILHRE